MKKIMEMLQNMKAKNEKKDNKGFSLVELIIVIAIMAILVGVVGTQVLPYLNKSKLEKDRQIVSSYSTAAVSAYSMVAGELSGVPSDPIDVYTGTHAAGTDAAKIVEKIKDLTSGSFPTDFKSDEATGATDVTVTYNESTHKVTVTLKNAKTPAKLQVESTM